MEELIDALEGALRLCGRCGGEGRLWAPATLDERGRIVKCYKACPACSEYREVLAEARDQAAMDAAPRTTPEEEGRR